MIYLIYNFHVLVEALVIYTLRDFKLTTKDWISSGTYSTLFNNIASCSRVFLIRSSSYNNSVVDDAGYTRILIMSVVAF